MKNSSYKHLIISVSAIIALILLYEVFTIFNKNDMFFPSFIDIVKGLDRIVENKGIGLLLKTLIKILIVIGVSFLISLFINFINYIFKYNIDIVNPIIFIIKAIPFAIVSVYLYILLFETKELIPYIVSFLVIFPIVYDGVKQGLSINKDIVDELALLKGSKRIKYTNVYFPLALSPMTITFMQSLSLGIKVMVMSEYICGVNGSIGEIINDAKLTLDFTLILGWLILLVIIIIVFDLITGILKKRLDYTY